MDLRILRGQLFGRKIQSQRAAQHVVAQAYDIVVLRGGKFDLMNRNGQNDGYVLFRERVPLSFFEYLKIRVFDQLPDYQVLWSNTQILASSRNLDYRLFRWLHRAFYAFKVFFQAFFMHLFL